MRYRCRGDKRRAAVLAHRGLNGIDDLEVVDRAAKAPALQRRTLVLRMLKPLGPAGLGPDARVELAPDPGLPRVRVRWVLTPAQLKAGEAPRSSDAAAYTELGETLAGAPDGPRTLVIATDIEGGAGRYRLLLRGAGPDRPPPGIDPQLAEVAFSFHVDAPAELDCRARPTDAPPRLTAPAIDYLAKDYASFRRLMLDRLATVAPDWTERSAADLGAAVVEVLAYTADHLSYYQDAVASEAYLGTARRRTSVRRHARLLDYPMHDGCNARVWACLEVATRDGVAATLPRGTPLLTQVDAPPGEVDPQDVPRLLRGGAEIFETTAPLTVHPGLDRLRFYLWGESRCELPAGATRATLDGTGVDLEHLKTGRVLVFEEERGPDSGKREDADVNHRHAVRLTEVVPGEDPVTGAFTDTGPLSVARKEHAAVRLADGAALVVGGVSRTGTAVATSDRFEPTGGTFAPGARLAAPRKDATATALADGSVLVTGGVDERGDPVATAELYVPSQQRFFPVGALAFPRYDHTATLLADGRVLIVGGTDRHALPPVAELYDPVTRRFARAGSLGVARRNHTATALADRRVLIAGGLDRDGTPLAAAELFDPDLEAFTPVAPMTGARRSHTATRLDDGAVLVVGGSDLHGTPIAGVERFSPDRLAFERGPDLLDARRDHSATLLSLGRVLVAGGIGTDGRFLASAELYDPASATFLATGELAVARGQHAATRLDDDSVLLTGGLGSAGVLASAERYTPPVRVAEVSWALADALPFALPIGVVRDPGSGRLAPISIAHGNVALADHGRTLDRVELDEPKFGERRPRLPRGPVTWRSEPDPKLPASAALAQDPRTTRPAVALVARERADLLAGDVLWGAADDADAVGGELWRPRRDLLASDRFARHFVVETEDDGTARLRFGDDEHGRRPLPGQRFDARFRIGTGRAGNIGADALAHAIRLFDPALRIKAVHNPLPAHGGVDPEPVEEVRLYAPQAFRRPERAVTVADYETIAARHPSVARAVATLRWTGSWYTVHVTVDRTGGAPVDAGFSAELQRFLERRSLLGYDVEIDAPRFVPLDIALTIHVEPGQLRNAVKEALLLEFGNTDLAGGRRGFFHPDNFTFGQPVYLSTIIAAAMRVPGVEWVDAEESAHKPNRFRRWSRVPRPSEAWKEGVIAVGRLEIVRLDNDPTAPHRGRFELFMEGGL